MKRLASKSLFGMVVLGLVAAAYPLATANTKARRSDCPGKVVCPLTGEEVCKDRCPLTAKANTEKAAESTALASEEEAELPPCCRAKN